jgi:hypothetical protein
MELNLPTKAAMSPMLRMGSDSLTSSRIIDTFVATGICSGEIFNRVRNAKLLLHVP